MTIEELTQRRASDVLRDTDRNSVGVVRILASAAGTPGQEREYEAGDEALVEAGQAEWVVAPVHLPAAGRRLDTDAEREPTPLAGVESYPPAEPTSAARRSEAREVGHVAAHSDDGVGAALAGKRADAARAAAASSAADVKTQAEEGGRGARSGPVTAASDLKADQPPVEAESASPDKPDPATPNRASSKKA